MRSYLSSLRSTRAIDFPDDTPTDLAKYGLDSPRLTVRVMAGKEGADTLTLLLGGETTQNSQKQVYAKRSDQATVYALLHPSVLVRFKGQAPLGAKVIELGQLRCNLCLKVYTAKAPEWVGPEKFDATSGSMIALLRYGTGVPWNRIEGLQAGFGIPLPASTQWDVSEAAYKKIAIAFEHLKNEAAQGDVFYNDDTPMKILSLMKENKERRKEKRGHG